MGLGKTAQACAALACSKPASAIIMCPSSLLKNWSLELGFWAGRDSQEDEKKSLLRNFVCAKNGKSVLTGHDIVSYSLVSGLLKNTPRKSLPKYDFAVLDESHFIKSRRALRTKAVMKITKHASKVLCLSGTPFSKPEDLFTQLRMLLPLKNSEFEFFPYLHNGRVTSSSKPLTDYFAVRYCSPELVFTGGPGRKEFMFKGQSRSQELNLVLSLVMIRRTKDLLPNLPPKVRSRVSLPGLSPSVSAFFSREIELLTKIREEKGSQAADCKLMQLVMKTCQYKEKSLKPWFNDVLFPEITSSQEKCIIFAHHHSVMDFVAGELDRLKLGFVKIDGRTKSGDRQALVKRFTEDTSLLFAVLGVQSAGTGLNFQVATQVVFAELTWNEKDMLQAEDRAHRIGVKSQVFIQYLCLENSTDDFMWRCIQRKINGVQKILNPNQKKNTSEKRKTSNTIDHHLMKIIKKN